LPKFAQLIAARKLQIAKLRRQIYGQRSERSARLIDQLALEFEELSATASEDELTAEQAAARTARSGDCQARRFACSIIAISALVNVLKRQRDSSMSQPSSRRDQRTGVLCEIEAKRRLRHARRVDEYRLGDRKATIDAISRARHGGGAIRQQENDHFGDL
jgi:Transposase C of IS166 homeodomain